MFYTKSKLPGGRTVRTEITDENVFTRCAECGCELPIDIVEILSDGESDLFSTSIVCSRCTVKKQRPCAIDPRDVKVPITYDGIVWLAYILSRSGYCEKIRSLFRQFQIDCLEDLSPEEYTDFGNALAKMATGTVEG
jgi:hypothetical protein